MKDYIRCCIANKFTLIGAILLFLTLLLLLTSVSSSPFLVIPSFIGGGLLGTTGFGLETFMSYRRTTRLTRNKKYNLIDIDLKSSMYCSRLGVNLAKKDYMGITTNL